MKKSFLLIAICIVGYMALTSHLVTKISARQISKIEATESSTGSQDKKTAEQSFLFSQNPNSETIILKFLKPNAFRNLEVSDFKGKKLFASRECKGTVQFDTKKYSEGTYFVNLITNDGEKISKTFQIH